MCGELPSLERDPPLQRHHPRFRAGPDPQGPGLALRRGFLIGGTLNEAGFAENPKKRSPVRFRGFPGSIPGFLGSGTRNQTIVTLVCVVSRRNNPTQKKIPAAPRTTISSINSINSTVGELFRSFWPLFLPLGDFRCFLKARNVSKGGVLGACKRVFWDLMDDQQFYQFAVPGSIHSQTKKSWRAPERQKTLRKAGFCVHPTHSACGGCF